MKKLIKTLSLLLVLVLITGCGGGETYSFNIVTGDKVDITINTGKGFKIPPTNKVPFEIYKGDNLLLTGNFIYMNEYNERISGLNPDAETISIIEREQVKGDITYTLYLSQIDGYESDYIYLIKINNSNTGIILTSIPNANRDDVVKAFEALTITAEKADK